MENIALIGIDLGKNSFHIHCQDHRGKAVYRKKFTRPKLIEFLATCPATTIAMEACGGSHFMARKLAELGHFPKLISPQFVRPFVKSNKNDFVDAEAICEAASRPSMRFVQPRTESQQAMRALHRVRESLVQDKVKTTNQMHAFLLEFGISVPRGAAVISRLGTVAKLAMRQPFVLFKGLTFQKLCLPGAFRPGDHHNKMLRPGLCVVHASPQYL